MREAEGVAAAATPASDALPEMPVQKGETAHQAAVIETPRDASTKVCDTSEATQATAAVDDQPPGTSPPTEGTRETSDDMLAESTSAKLTTAGDIGKLPRAVTLNKASWKLPTQRPVKQRSAFVTSKESLDAV